jgi:hypothetical protein
MGSWTDSSLASWNVFCQWAIAFSGGLTVIATVILIFVSAEIGRRQEVTISASQLAAAEANKAAQESRTKQTELEQHNIVLRTDLARVQTEADNARRTMLAVQDRIKQRTITPDQKARLANALNRIPKTAIPITYEVTDPEASTFARDIMRTLRQMSWDVIEVTGMVPMRGVTPEFAILVQDKNHIPVWAAPLHLAFADVNMPMSAINTPLPSNVKQYEAVVYVGPKHSQPTND